MFVHLRVSLPCFPCGALTTSKVSTHVFVALKSFIQIIIISEVAILPITICCLVTPPPFAFNSDAERLDEEALRLAAVAAAAAGVAARLGAQAAAAAAKEAEVERADYEPFDATNAATACTRSAMTTTMTTTTMLATATGDGGGEGLGGDSDTESDWGEKDFNSGAF